MQNIRKKFGWVKKLIESEYWSKRGSTKTKITKNPLTLKSALLKDFFRNGGSNPKQIILQLLQCDGFTASLGKGKKKYLVYLTSTDPVKATHEFTHVAMARLRSNQKRQAGEFAEEVMAYSMELEALFNIDKKKYEQRLSENMASYIGRMKSNPLVFTKDSIGRILAKMIHQNFKGAAERAMIRERLSKEYFTEPEKALAWVSNEIKISKQF